MLKFHDILLIFLVGIAITAHLSTYLSRPLHGKRVDDLYLVCETDVSFLPKYNTDTLVGPESISEKFLDSLSTKHILLKVDFNKELIVWGRNVAQLDKTMASLSSPNQKLKDAFAALSSPSTFDDTDLTSLYFKEVTEPDELILYTIQIDRIDGSFTIAVKWYGLVDQQWQPAKDTQQTMYVRGLLYAGMCKKYDATLRIF